MKTIISILILLITNLIQAQQTLFEYMLHNGVTREYIVYVPATYNASIPTPLMFNFHGFGMSANDQMTGGGDMRAVAETGNFILVYPQGTVLLFGLTHWNVGSWTIGSTADDIGFTEAMIDTLAANYNIDLDRVYSCGYSNGGYFSFELACQLSERIAAVGSVGGTMSTETFNSCIPSHPTPVITIHGTTDTVVSYNGGVPANSESLADIITFWTNYNNTIGLPIISNLPDIDSSDGSTVELSIYDNGENCTSVEHYKVIGGDHDWPGSSGNMDINASTIIWNFVSQYDINGLIGCSTLSITEINSSQINFKVFPNPFDDKITIETDFSTDKEFKIYNTLGKLMIIGQLTSESNTIDVSFLPPNIYIFMVENQSIKLVKRK